MNVQNPRHFDQPNGQWASTRKSAKLPATHMEDKENDHETSSFPAGLYLGPVPRPLNAENEFFDAGNINRALLCKINVFAIISGGGDAMDFEDQQQSYECMFQGCNSSFPSLRRVSLYWFSHVWRGAGSYTERRGGAFFAIGCVPVMP